MSDTALEVTDLTSGYGEAMVLRQVALSVPAGAVLAVVGKNGVGKSTLLKTVMGFLPARTGRIRILGEDVTGAAPHRIALRAVAYCPQDQAIFQDLTVEENLRLGLRGNHKFERGFERVTIAEVASGTRVSAPRMAVAVRIGRGI